MPRITPTGNEFLVNAVTADGQVSPVTTALANGRFIVVWVGSVQPGVISNTTYANADIRAQIYNADGTPSGGEFVVNASTSGVQFAPSITQLTDGNILIAWQDGIGSLTSPASTPAATIRAQEFTPAGATVGAAFQIGAGSEAVLPAITGVAGGGFFAAWQQGRSGNVVGQIYDNANAAVGSQFTIDSTNLAVIATPRLATLVDGNVAVAWQNAASATQSLFSVQVYSAAGAPLFLETGVQGGSITVGSIGNLIALSSGGFALSDQVTFGPQVFAEFTLFFPNGTFGTSTRISTQAVGSGTIPRLAPLPSGGLVATWVDNNTTGTQPDIFAQAYNGIGDPIGDIYTINQTLPDIQSTPAITALSTGDLIIVWRDDSATGGDTSGAAIRARFVDYDATNTAPVAPVLETFYINAPFGTNPLRLNPNDVAGLASDADEDLLTIDSISNVVNGSAVIDADNILIATFAQPLTGALAFDYTVTDGNGGFATGRVRIINPTDSVTLRGPGSVIVDVLANDFLAARPQGYSLVLSNPYAQVVSVGGSPQVLVNPFGGATGYYDLLVGQTQTFGALYYVVDSSTGLTEIAAQLEINLQGWAQIGSTARDTLIGSALADSLQGGTGAANELYGFGGDDVYTVRAVGDSIVEAAGGGIDLVRTDLSVFVLPANVENLQQIGNPTTFVAIGNDANNSILGLSANNGSVMAGGNGNDTLIWLTGTSAELIGGAGDDIFQFTSSGTSVVEFANGGIDTVVTGNSGYFLGANVENLTYTGAGRFSGVGNALDNIITGGTFVASELQGGIGNDTYVIRNAGDSIIEAGGAGIDTVQTALSIYRLSAANVENLTYTGSGTFTGIGNSGSNIITGGARDDYLFAGDGADTLVGGAGADVFFFDTAIDLLDIVRDFTSGSDRLFFNQTVFTHTPSFALVQGAGAQTSTTTNSTFLYNATSGLLSFDTDGTGAGAAIALANLSPGLTLTTADFAFYG